MTTEAIIDEWTEDQIVEAFSAFRNPNAETDPEEDTQQLKSHLAKLGKTLFGAPEVISSAQQFVLPHCADKLAWAILNWLRENTSSPTTH